MYKFGEFVAEGGYGVPVVSISKDKVDLSKDATRNEINRNISAELSRHWMSPYGGWMKVRRILEMYSINLPKVIFEDEIDGEEVVALSQFGEVWGADVEGKISQPNTPDDSEYFLYFDLIIRNQEFFQYLS